MKITQSGYPDLTKVRIYLKNKKEEEKFIKNMIEEKELNLVEILKNAPKGTKLYSPMCGECELDKVSENFIYVIVNRGEDKGYFKHIFCSNGMYHVNRGECVLFPSKENRDWSTFKTKKDASLLSSFSIAENEKKDFVGNGFIKCYANFKDFKEGETYWLEYLGDDKYNVRSDNLLGKTYHITPCQLYTIFKKLTCLEKEPLFKVGDSEKIKGMIGSKTRADEVLKWLNSQGAKEHTYKGNDEDSIYFVYQGLVKLIDIKYSFLFDIVELPERWRAKYDEEYYFVSDRGDISGDSDIREALDNDRFDLGNYFKTPEEAGVVAKKVREIFKAESKRI